MFNYNEKDKYMRPTDNQIIALICIITILLMGGLGIYELPIKIKLILTTHIHNEK
jgi:hypothetical protein